jgi:hypothetical protein
MNPDDITFVFPIFHPNKYEIDNLKFCINSIAGCNIIVIEQVQNIKKSKVKTICDELGCLYIRNQLYLDDINKPLLLKSVLSSVKTEYVWYHDPNIYVKFKDILAKIKSSENTKQIITYLKKINLQDTIKIQNKESIEVKFLKPDNINSNIFEISFIADTKRLAKYWHFTLTKNIENINEYGIYLFNAKKFTPNINISVDTHIRKNLSDNNNADLQFRIINNIKKPLLDLKNEKILTGKNLIYYTLFDRGNNYVKLLKLSIESIYRYMEDPFEILIFTDESTKEKIIKQINFKINFCIMSTPCDGIEASKIKTNIYNYENIDNYENILFLDADIILTKEVKGLFSKAKHTILHTAYNKNLQFNFLYDHICHGLGEVFSDKDISLMQEFNQFPFNAGQFMFKNTSLLKYHFIRLNKFIRDWPGPYFFEQSFMNVYFCINKMTDPLLNEFVEFNVIGSNDISQNKPMVHFCGEALNGKSKLNYIKKCLM